MLRKPFHGIPKLPAIGTPSPPFSPVRESPARLTPLSSRSPLPPLFYCQKNLPPTSHFRFTRQTTIFPPLSTSSFATAPPSTAAHFSRAPEPNPNTAEDQVEGEGSDRERRSQICAGDVGTLESPKPKRKRKLNPRHSPLVMWWIELSSWEKTKKIVSALCSETPQDVVDRFYREMSKEVQTILHERDQRTLPEELSRRVVVTCVSGDGTCDVFMLRTKQRSQESCIEIEVESVTTYVRPQVIYVQYPGKPLERLRLKRNYKVVNKLEVSCGRGDRVAFEEAMEYGGKVIPGRPEQVILLRTTWAMQLWEKTKLLVGNLLKRKDLLYFLFRWFLKRWAMQLWKKTKLIVAKLLYVKGMDRPEVPSKKPAVSTVKMLSSLGVAVAGVAFLSGIYFGWKK